MALPQRFWPYLLILWALIIMVLSVIPGADLPSLSIWQPDKVMHAFVYAILTILAYRTLQILPAFIGYPKKAFVSTALCILYGFIIELIQLLLPTRSFDMIDELANTIGCLISLIGILVFSPRRS